MPADRGSAARHAAYLSLLGLQTAAASLLFWTIFPTFQRLVLRSGQPQMLEARTVLVALAAVLVLQACYWVRYHHVPVWAPLGSALIGHLLVFASRASFFFGGALFSAVVFRHIPQLGFLPPLGQGLAEALGLFAVLFSLFCYSLELERLGRAIETGGRPAPQAD